MGSRAQQSGGALSTVERGPGGCAQAAQSAVTFRGVHTQARGGAGRGGGGDGRPEGEPPPTVRWRLRTGAQSAGRGASQGERG